MIAYVAKDLASGVCLTAHEDVQMPAYSTIKVLLAAAFWRAVERGELSESQPYAFQPWGSVGGAACCAASGTPPRWSWPTTPI